jgi:2-iminobutanoate/2-iminopropanoate deaminase
MKKVYTSSAPTPAGHYSQAMIHNGLVYVSGQLPIYPATGEKELGPIEKQTRQVLENLREILIQSGSDLDKVIKTTVYISEITLWDEVNEVYAEYFGKVRPARSVVPVNELHFGFQIEMEAIAAIEE